MTTVEPTAREPTAEEITAEEKAKAKREVAIKKAEEERLAKLKAEEEAARKAEEERKAKEAVDAKKAEEARKAEEAKKAEENRKAEEKAAIEMNAAEEKIAADAKKELEATGASKADIVQIGEQANAIIAHVEQNAQASVNKPGSTATLEIAVKAVKNCDKDFEKCIIAKWKKLGNVGNMHAASNCQREIKCTKDDMWDAYMNAFMNSM
jgi:membrane protein involved in colicin uptake